MNQSDRLAELSNTIDISVARCNEIVLEINEITGEQDVDYPYNRNSMNKLRQKYFNRLPDKKPPCTLEAAVLAKLQSLKDEIYNIAGKYGLTDIQYVLDTVENGVNRIESDIGTVENLPPNSGCPEDLLSDLISASSSYAQAVESWNKREMSEAINFICDTFHCLHRYEHHKYLSSKQAANYAKKKGKSTHKTEVFDYIENNPDLLDKKIKIKDAAVFMQVELYKESFLGITEETIRKLIREYKKMAKSRLLKKLKIELFYAYAVDYLKAQSEFIVYISQNQQK